MAFPKLLCLVSTILAALLISSCTSLIVTAGESPELLVFADSLEKRASPTPKPEKRVMPLIIGTTDNHPKDMPPSDKIVGGAKAQKNITKRMVRVISTSSSGKIASCTGTVISRNYILTAAHCFFLGDSEKDEASTSKNSYVLVGEKSTNAYYGAKRSNKYKMKNIFIHKDYRYDGTIRNLVHDIAVVQLTTKIKKKQYFAMSLGSPPSKSGTGVIAAGYGLRASNQSPPKKVAQATVVYKDQKWCENWIGWSGRTGKREVCATSADNKKTGICNGDSGGPLMIKSGKKIRQIGVASFFSGDKCQGKDAVYYYMRVSYYKKMILNKVKKNKNNGWKKL